MKKTATAQDVLIYELQGLHDGERKFVKYLETYAGIMSSKDLRNTCNTCIENLEPRINKLRWAFQYLDEPFTARSNESVSAILADCEAFLRGSISEKLRDDIITAAIHGALQYKMAVYRTCMAFARELRMHTVEDILKEILTVEIETDRHLMKVSGREIGNDAYAGQAK